MKLGFTITVINLHKNNSLDFPVDTYEEAVKQADIIKKIFKFLESQQHLGDPLHCNVIIQQS